MRQRRHRQRVRLFLASLVTASGLIFLFHDGPDSAGAKLSPLEPLAQASETVESLWNESVQVIHPPSLDEIVMPPGFRPQWFQNSLDQGRIQLKSLRQLYSIGQTTNGLGSEYFPYAAFQFEQLASQVESQHLAEKLHRLSAQAQALGNTLREAGGIRYDGQPSRGMVHLQVREDLLSVLQNLNHSEVVQVAYNEQGRILSQVRPTGQEQAGESLSQFLGTLRTVLNDPDARQYPETMGLIRAQSEWLSAVARHVTPRWESTQYCHRQCNQVTYLRVYAQQTLPTEERPRLLATSL